MLTFVSGQKASVLQLEPPYLCYYPSFQLSLLFAMFGRVMYTRRRCKARVLCLSHTHSVTHLISNSPVILLAIKRKVLVT